MKKVIKSILAMSLLVLFAGCSKKEATTGVDAIKAKGVLVVATSPDYAPMEFLDTTKSASGEPVGSDIALAQYIADALGVELKLELMDFNAVLTAVSTGKADMAISGFSWKEDRQEAFELSIGYNIEQDESSCQGLVVTTENYNKYQTMSDFFGKKVAAQSGSLQESYVTKQINNVDLELVTSIDVGVLMLQSNKVDALALSCDLAKAYAKSDATLSFAIPQFDTSDLAEHDGNVVAVQKGNTDLIEFVNEQIKVVNETGLYAKWYAEAKTLAASIGIEFEEE